MAEPSDQVPVAMLESLTHQSFAPHVGTEFRLQLGPDGALPFTLIEAQAVGSAPGPRPDGTARRQPFALLFRGPRQPVLPQRIYRLEHAAMGPLELFIVPIGPDEAGLRYEAVFT
jgi:hypothetical protein